MSDALLSGPGHAVADIAGLAPQALLRRVFPKQKVRVGQAPQHLTPRPSSPDAQAQA